MRELGVLFVCLGNICRSPSAEAVFRRLTDKAGLGDRLLIDSAGTVAWQVGKPPDPRAQAEARRRGLDLAALRARQALPADFQRFRYVLAMDWDNYHNLALLCPPGEEHRLALFLDFAPEVGRREVPDPYYGSREEFTRMFDLIERGAAGLLRHIQRRHL